MDNTVSVSIKYSRQMNQSTWVTIEAGGVETIETTREEKLKEIALSARELISTQYEEIKNGPRTTSS